MTSPLTFIDTIPDDKPLNVQGFTRRDGSNQVARLQVGYVADTQEIISALVVLAPAIGKGANCKELFFSIVIANEATGEVDEISDGRQTKRFLNSTEARQKVLGVVCTLACHLVSLERPEVLHYVSAQIDLPKKALHKYEALCKALGMIGYRGREVDKYLGNHMWICERVDA